MRSLTDHCKNLTGAIIIRNFQRVVYHVIINLKMKPTGVLCNLSDNQCTILLQQFFFGNVVHITRQFQNHTVLMH